MKEFLNLLVDMWPYMTEGEKDRFANTLTKGKIVEIIKTFQEIRDDVVKRVGGSK